MNRIKELRELNSITIDELVNELEITRRTLYSYEVLDKPIKSDILIKLSKIFNSSVDYIIGNVDYDIFKNEKFISKSELENNLLNMEIE